MFVCGPDCCWFYGLPLSGSQLSCVCMNESINCVFWWLPLRVTIMTWAWCMAWHGMAQFTGEDEYNTWLSTQFKGNTSDVASLYPLANYHSPFLAAAAIIGDSTTVCPARRAVCPSHHATYLR